VGGDDDDQGYDASGDDDDPGNPDAPLPVFPDAPTCGEQVEPIEVTNLGDPPDLLIVLDRSESMLMPIITFPPNFTPKWNIMRDALNGLSTSFEDNIRFGLLEFPSDNDCGVGSSALRVSIDLNQAAEIHAYFASRGPGGYTPAHLALGRGATYYASIPVNPEGQYVLFATDGEPNCAGTDPEASSATETVAAVAALAAAGVKTYVLGFGGSFYDGVLNDAALAGGVPRAGGPPHYYAANNAAELDAVLQTISGGIIVPSCSYALASTPPDPDNVAVTADSVPVPRSTAHTNGWDYYPDMNTITFFGSYCTDIQSGAITEISFTYGCPGPVID